MIILNGLIMKLYLIPYKSFFLMAILATSCTTKSSLLNKKDIEAIQNLEKSYVEFSNKNDWEHLSLLLTSDVVIFRPNDSAVAGQSTNLIRFKGMGNVPIQYSHITKEIDGNGNLAYLQGIYDIRMQLPDNAQPYSDYGKYVWVLKKQPDKSWKIHRIIWNSSAQLITGK